MMAALSLNAAAAAAAADTKAPPTPERPGTKRQRESADDTTTTKSIRGATGTRRGKWSAEEEAFAARLIRDFDAGLLALENGATLRAFLSKKLNCSAMRISKKFAGEKCLGKQIFLRRSGVDEQQLKQEQELLDKLEAAFLASIASSERSPPPAAPRPPPVSRPASSTEPSSASEDDEAPPTAAESKSAPPRTKRDIGDAVDTSNSSPLTLLKLGTPCPSTVDAHPQAAVVEASPRSVKRQPATAWTAPLQDDNGQSHAQQLPPPVTTEPERILEQLDAVAHIKGFRDLGQTGFIGREARELAEELVDAHRRANEHKSASFSDLPKAECIQSPPAALMLELGPTPRRVPHPTIGAYAFSIARGTSNSSLQRLADHENVVNDDTFSDDLAETPSCFFDDDFDDHLSMDLDGLPLAECASRRNSFHSFSQLAVDDDPVACA